MIAFFCRNGVAANLLLALIVIAGSATLFLRKIPLEVFPEFEIRQIQITVPYRGSNPAEIEESIVMRIEEAIADLEGIEEMVSTATSSSGSVSVEVDDDYDVKTLRDEIETRLDSLVDFPPGDAESASVQQAKSDRWVISVVLSADMNERDLANLGARVRDELVERPEITNASLQGTRAYEISIEVDEAALERYGLTFAEISTALRAYSIDIPAGTLETDSGHVALRTKGRAYNQEQFENITLKALPNGTRLKIGDVARVTDGFHEDEFVARFNGERCVIIPVFREGSQSAIRIANEVKDYIAENKDRLPPGVQVNFWGDSSKIVKGRLITLLDSAWKSMLFVFVILTLFLRPSLGFWVMLGIPVCFLGTLALMPYLGVSINIVSLFGFILVLGVVVDDAIVTGENVYTHQKENGDIVDATIKGTEEVTLPVMFGVFTTMLAFVTLYFAEGFMGSWLPQIATVVICVLAFSLIESKLILPSHLTHSPRKWLKGLITFFLGRTVAGYFARFYRGFCRVQQWIAGTVEWFVKKVFQPALNQALIYRYAVLALFLGVMTLILGALYGGAVKQVKFPSVASERATCRLTMEEGTPYEVTAKYVMMMEQIVMDMKEEFVGPDGVSIIEDIFSSIGGQGVSSSKSSARTGQSSRGEVVFYITAPEDRELKIDTREIANIWRERIEEQGGIVGAKQLYFRAEIGRGRDPIRIQLRGNDGESLSALAELTKDRLKSYEGLFDIEDNLDTPRDEIQLEIRPEAEQFGLTLTDLARQVRQGFYGEEIQRLQRKRDEVRVMLKYPLKDRKSLASLESMKIRTRDGTQVPFTTVAKANVVKTYPKIERIDRNRAVQISADADKEVAKLDSVREEMGVWLEEKTQHEFHGIGYDFVGEAKDAEESSHGMVIGSMIIVFGIYAMLAIPFRSYVQPLIVMSVIPFGLIGAVMGHIFEDMLKPGGMPIGTLSYLGMLALAGVVVNDSLGLVDYINRRRRAGDTVFEAVSKSGAARFRAIILTSATTFAGLFPLIRMQATQAQFLIPMAVSLGYGILFATLITLFLVPINYLILDDLSRGFKYLFSEDDKEKEVAASA
ncbi:MAG: efflux RND transporter permease subunit [Verrucomicrobiales bacterium]|nr:efflux RND transporter permease subunit [Verrucomicrobiales bacterium]